MSSAIFAGYDDAVAVERRRLVYLMQHATHFGVPRQEITDSLVQATWAPDSWSHVRRNLERLVAQYARNGQPLLGVG